MARTTIGWALVAVTAVCLSLISTDDAQARHRRGGSYGSYGSYGSFGGGGSFGGLFSRNRGGDSGCYDSHESKGGFGSNGGYGSHGSHGGAYHDDGNAAQEHTSQYRGDYEPGQPPEAPAEMRSDESGSSNIPDSESDANSGPGIEADSSSDSNPSR